MSLFARRVIFYLLVLLFLLSAPLVLGYAAGFRYNFKQKRLVKTGALVLESSPKDASITLNDSSRAERTPAKIMNLTPGEYRILVKKTGYLPWKKKLDVLDQQVTLAKHILLLKDRLPALVAEGNVTDVGTSPAREAVFFKIESSSFAELWQLKDRSPELFWRSADPSVSLGADFGEKMFIARGGKAKSAFIFSPDKIETSINLGNIVPLNHSKIKFDAKESDTVYVITRGTLQLVNLRTKLVKDLREHTQDILPQKDGLLIVADAKTPQLVKREKDAEKVILSLNPGTYELALPSLKWLPIFEQQTNQTILLDMAKEWLTPKDAPTLSGKPVGFTRDGEEAYLITASSEEIWSYNPRSDFKELVTRVSEEIKQVFLHPDGQIIFYVTPKTVRAVELDRRDVRQSWELAQFEKIEKAALSRDGRFIFIAGVRGNKSGLWKLELR